MHENLKKAEQSCIEAIRLVAKGYQERIRFLEQDLDDYKKGAFAEATAADEARQKIGELNLQIIEKENRIQELQSNFFGFKAHYHDVHCNTSRTQPMGCEGCSCDMYQRTLRAENKLEESITANIQTFCHETKKFGTFPPYEVSALFSNKEEAEQFTSIVKDFIEYNRDLSMGERKPGVPSRAEMYEILKNRSIELQTKGER